MEISNKILSDITVYMKYAKYMPELNRRKYAERQLQKFIDWSIEAKGYLKYEDLIKYSEKYGQTDTITVSS